MRPPRIAAEYSRLSRFDLIYRDASMRPPRIAAEYSQDQVSCYACYTRFNEAAANRGGIRESVLGSYGKDVRFNEAAANRGGIHAEDYARLEDSNLLQ